MKVSEGNHICVDGEVRTGGRRFGGMATGQRSQFYVGVVEVGLRLRLRNGPASPQCCAAIGCIMTDTVSGVGFERPGVDGRITSFHRP